MFTPLDPFQGYVSPIRLTIAPEQWANRTWNVTSHGRDDCAKDENTLFTAFGTFEGDQYYMAKKNSIRAINLASTFKDKRLATKLTGVCVATPVKEFNKETFLDQVTSQFSITSEEVNVESYRACTDDVLLVFERPVSQPDSVPLPIFLPDTTHVSDTISGRRFSEKLFPYVVDATKTAFERPVTKPTIVPIYPSSMQGHDIDHSSANND